MAMNASFTSTVNMNRKPAIIIVIARVISIAPGPQRSRTRCMSFVQRAIRSPVCAFV
ncbi:hypothetical protein D3C83_249200 [compost metagenome]